MKIKINVELPFPNEIQFYDVCKGLAKQLEEMAVKVLESGDVQYFIGTYDVHTENDDNERVGEIHITQNSRELARRMQKNEQK